MNILQFCTDFRKGGIQIHVLELSDWLVGQGHEVVFAAEPRRAFIDTDTDSFIPLSMKDVSNTDGNLFSRVFSLLKNAITLRREISGRNFDLIHVHETAPALVAKLATIGMKIPIVMTFHGSEPSRIPSAARTARRCADLVASPSRLVLDELIEHGVDRGKTQVFGLGIKPHPEISGEIKANLRNTYLNKGAGTLIFSPSRLERQKGIDVMIQVAKRVSEKHPDTAFVVAGGGDWADRVEGWAEKAGVRDNMYFLGPIDTVAEHLAAADMVLLTSRWEALPISIVEAFRAERPVIATDCGGVSELIDNEVGRLCAVEDVDALTEAVLEFIEQPDLRQEKGRGALTRSGEARFDPQAVHAHILETYEAMTGRGANQT